MVSSIPILFSPTGTKVHWNNKGHFAVAGSTGSGKSTFLKYFVYQLSLHSSPCDELYILDYKNSSDWRYFRGHENYFSYDRCQEGFQKIYTEFEDRLGGRSDKENICYVVIEEFASFQASIRTKKERDELQYQLGQLLRLSRAVGNDGGFRLILCAQQLSANLFGGGTADRDNIGARLLLGGGATTEGRKMLFEISDEDILPTNSPTGKGYYQEQGGRIQKVLSPMIKNFDTLGSQRVIKMMDRSKSINRSHNVGLPPIGGSSALGEWKPSVGEMSGNNHT
ncbi:FtsK/SpoIIIE domain-containing protein [Streptococcus suis]|uniref:AAA family ATPase n=3 Tax=Streptococcus suis TaxID=1307 RepID=A0AAW5LPB8_STRSU|nr:FtsK/SpoIIIE domain-containing protein [Streptococcus suis]MCO8221283.1 AAA family ATPase [Streptococcus suis]MCR1233620.1 AAA family ATPase [Streptococcus suis]HEM3512898.1 AAA family ATPase [Streptococcus suis]HEM3527532.1 AAA family ATPase [Streptococcus suis]